MYAVTDRRALLIEGGFRRSIRSFTGEELEGIERREGVGGVGDLIFRRETFRRGNRPRTRAIGFFAIPEVKRVEALVKDLRS